MNELLEKKLYCPYCGEPIDALIDPSIAQQSYVEDCQVCCKPISFNVTILDDENALVELTQEGE